MDKAILSLLIIFVFSVVGCEEENPYEDFKKEQLAKSASEKYEAILRLAQPTSCTDPAEWHITEIGSVCGLSHLAYHESVDKKKLIYFINNYNLLIEVYRPYEAPYIFCSPYRDPTGVVCEDLLPTVQYEEWSTGTASRGNF